MWVVLFDDLDGEPILAFAVQEAMAHMDLEMTRNLASIIDQVPANAALLAVPRHDGSPDRGDRQLWRDLQVLLSDGSTQLLDLVVVGHGGYWSARRDSEDLFAA